jgi:uncharacterized protein YuzE
MKKVKVFHDKKGNSLTIWFDDSNKEEVCEEIGEDTVIMKDKDGHIIGIEKLNYSIPYSKNLPIEILSA